MTISEINQEIKTKMQRKSKSKYDTKSKTNRRLLYTPSPVIWPDKVLV
jgi:hypothetical protein